MSTKTLLAGLLALGLAGGAWAATEAGAEQQWQQHMTQMRELQQSWMAGKTPEERHKLMLEHRQAMGGSMQMMGGCPMHGSMQMGMGKGAGMMMPLDTPEQVDQHIQHMEQMLEQLKAHREMLSKP